MDIVINLKNNALTAHPQDVELVQELANDCTVVRAAQNLGQKKKTAEGRLFRIKQRTGLKTIQGVVLAFYKNGLLK